MRLNFPNISGKFRTEFSISNILIIIMNDDCKDGIGRKILKYQIHSISAFSHAMYLFNCTFFAIVIVSKL